MEADRSKLAVKMRGSDTFWRLKMDSPELLLQLRILYAGY